MQVNDVQISKADNPAWCNKHIYKTLLQFMYGGTFNDPKNLHGKRVTVVNKNSDIYKACRIKTNFCQFCLSTYDTM